ncbi:DUF5327 family protein [Amphibacillus sp. Q70]|uniref:DUF5327 family protein n=1 Tax=Amphibacillus sp. Q70 TaxID=3453416 RepID=UPI003F83C5A3
MINYEKIVMKMAEEIERAKESNDYEKIKEHVRVVNLLADLILDDEQVEKSTKNDKTISDELELRKMLGESYQPQQKVKSIDNYEQPDSLLDF